MNAPRPLSWIVALAAAAALAEEPSPTDSRARRAVAQAGRFAAALAEGPSPDDGSLTGATEGRSAAAVGDPSPGDYRTRRSLARAAAAEGRFAEAGALLEDAVQLYPEDFGLRLELGFAWLRAGKWPEAERAYRAALALNEASFDARLGLADVLAAMGRWAELRDVTEALLAERDEATVHTRHALAHFWLGDLARAQRHSERALALNPGDIDALLGLAWVAQRRGEAAQARAGFEQVRALATTAAQARASDEEGRAGFEHMARARASADEGLALLGPRHRVGASLHGLAQGSGAPLAAGGVATVDALLDDRWLVAGRYRFFSTPVAAGEAGWTQHEGWLRLGLRAPQAELVVHGALLELRTWGGALLPTSELAWLLGLSGRVRAWADWLGSAVLTRSPALTVLQGELGGRLPLARWLSLYLGARGQWADGEWRIAGVGFVQASGARWTLGVGGAYGPTVRPVELDVAALYLVPNELRWRAAARASVGVTARWWLMASYDLEAYLVTGADDRLLHRVSLGIGIIP
ncbi:MAG: tetratricopeptide repeat protein [Archangium sp.]|nr:tetratricopeptide repeat protein [Archangium sp.]